MKPERFSRRLYMKCTFALFPLQEFEIELEGSQTLRLLCYEKCSSRTKQSKEEGEITDKIVAKGQIKVRMACVMGGRGVSEDSEDGY